MDGSGAEGRISLLKASLIAIISFAILFSSIVLAILMYTGLIIQREKLLVNQLLPELGAVHRLTVAASSLQSQGSLMQASQSDEELQMHRAYLDDSITTTRQTIGTLVMVEQDERSRFEEGAESMAGLVLNLADIKQRQFKLKQQIEDQKRHLFDEIEKMTNLVRQQEVRLTEQLLDKGKLLTSTNLLDGASTQSRDSFSDKLNEYDQINLAIQDYLLFGQDLASLSAIVESVPLLTSSISVDLAMQEDMLLISAMVSRGIYINDKQAAQKLLTPLEKLRDSLRKPDNLFALQKTTLTLEEAQDSLSRLMLERKSEILEQTDKLQDSTSDMVADLAAQTLTGLERYRLFLGLLCLLGLCLMAGISYWLLYRKTVLPLVEITQRFNDVGSSRFPEKAEQYYLKEFSTLSTAMQQLDSVQKVRQVEGNQMQQINKELKRANEDLGQFAHIASHDLQEPLRKLQQFSDILEEDYESLLDDEGRYFLRTIRTSAQRMSMLIKETLAYSRAGSANQTLEAVDLAALLVSLIDEADLAVRDSQAEVTVGALPMVHASKLGMAQLFRNLILNAIKYCKPETPPIISINSRMLENDALCKESKDMPLSTSRKLCISVRDNGIGIPEKYQQRIFRPFERLHNDAIKGTGIGLAMCRKVCDSHGWELSVSSEPGVGTTFDIHLPEAAIV